jgi:hypothetical protein
MSNNNTAADLTSDAIQQMLAQTWDRYKLVPTSYIIPPDEWLRDRGWSDADIAELKRRAVSA